MSLPLPRSRLLSAVAALAMALCGATAPAWAEVSGRGADETAASAYGPLQPGVPVSGAFVSPSDVDYLAFRVGRAGETLSFTVRNTTAGCHDPNGEDCPVYATLMDSSGTAQVGGDNSDAGTIATYGDTEAFNWTFSAPGTYYVLMESNGDLSPGSPAYAVTMSAAGGSGSGGGGGGSGGGGGGSGITSSPPLVVRSVLIHPHQHGGTVRARLVLAQPIRSLSAEVVAVNHGRSRVLARQRHGAEAAGVHRLALRLPAGVRRQIERGHALRVHLRITIRTRGGGRLLMDRRVTLTR